MLSLSDNEQLTRIGSGGPMGSMMREYWMPALVSSELPEPDCDPVRRPRAKWWPWRVRNVPGLNAVHRAEDFVKPSSRREWMLMPLAQPSTEQATDGTGAFPLDLSVVRRRRVDDPIIMLDLAAGRDAAPAAVCRCSHGHGYSSGQTDSPIFSGLAR
jgi:hypothetical protein